MTERGSNLTLVIKKSSPYYTLTANLKKAVSDWKEGIQSSACQLVPNGLYLGFPAGSDSKESACNAGDLGLIPGSGRSPRAGNGYPLQYSYLENSMDWASGLQSMRLQRVRHDQVTIFFFLYLINSLNHCLLNLLWQRAWKRAQVLRTKLDHRFLIAGVTVSTVTQRTVTLYSISVRNRGQGWAPFSDISNHRRPRYWWRSFSRPA